MPSYDWWSSRLFQWKKRKSVPSPSMYVHLAAPSLASMESQFRFSSKNDLFWDHTGDTEGIEQREDIVADLWDLKNELINDQLRYGSWQKPSISELRDAKSATVRAGSQAEEGSKSWSSPTSCLSPPPSILHTASFTFLKQWIMPPPSLGLLRARRIMSRFGRQGPCHMGSDPFPTSSPPKSHALSHWTTSSLPTSRHLFKSTDPHNWCILSTHSVFLLQVPCLLLFVLMIFNPLPNF